MTSREYPWHQRKALLKHHRWFRNLVDLHAITQAWASETDFGSLDNAPFTAELTALSSGEQSRLEPLLDDTSPEDLLSRLEAAVLGAQAWTCLTLFERAGSSKEDALKSILEQATWTLGKDLAEARWKDMSGASRGDLRAIFLTLLDSPISRGLGENAFLMRRGLASSVEFEFRHCPHGMAFPESEESGLSRDALCSLHSAWIRGYLYGMNHLAVLEYVPRGSGQARCSHHWKLTPPA